MKNFSIKKISKNNFKALILAGGRGKRLEGYIKGGHKCLLHFGGRPLIEYSLNNAINLGVSEIVIVVGYLAEKIINRYGNAYKGTPIRYAIQWEQKGLVHAIECGRETIKNSDFILLLGDEFVVGPDHKSMFDFFSGSDAFAVCGMIKTNDPKQISKTYSILFDEKTNKIFRLVEKPKNVSNELMGTGNIIFSNKIYNYIEMTPINQIRGEKELPDLIQCAIDVGKDVFWHHLSATYVNVNMMDDILIVKSLTSRENNGKK